MIYQKERFLSKLEICVGYRFRFHEDQIMPSQTQKCRVVNLVGSPVQLPYPLTWGQSILHDEGVVKIA